MYRRLIPYILRWCLLTSVIVLSACADDGTCKIASIGDLPVLNSRGVPLVKAAINGHPVALIVDTGAQISSVWPKQAAKLGLESQFEQVRMRGTGGETLGGVAVAETIALGSATASNISFVTVGNLLDGRMIDGLPVVGLFGADFLSNYDVVLDLPDHRINLYDIRGCEGMQPGWHGRFYKINVDR